MLAALSACAPVLAGAQAGGRQFYYCAAGMDPARNLYMSAVFAADVRDPAAIGDAFRAHVEQQFGYEAPLRSLDPCKAFPLADWADKAKREDVESSRALRANVIETGWTYAGAAPIE
jgi:hypothetical protein